MRLLIVEDDALIADGLVRAMRAAGHAVDHAPDGITADDALRQYPYSLVILDLGLPDGNGIDLIRDLRGWSDVPVLILSARSQENDKIDALDAGADDYLTKPFSPRELALRVRSVLRRAPAPAPTQPQEITVGELTVSTAARSVNVAGQPVGLTNREFGERMFLAEKTVKNYVSSILSKLGLQRRTQAAVFVAKVKSE